MLVEKRHVLIQGIFSGLGKGIMSILVRMPTENELAELSYRELNDCIHFAFYQWHQAVRKGKGIAESEQILQAYDNEQLKRLHRLEKYFMKLAAQPAVSHQQMY